MLGRVKRGGFRSASGRADVVRRPQAARGGGYGCAGRQPLIEVQAEHERLMQRIGLEPEGRKYTPHVTLARLRESPAARWRIISPRAGYFRTSPFRVSRFVLFSSRDSVGGGPYVVEASYPAASQRSARRLCRDRSMRDCASNIAVATPWRPPSLRASPTAASSAADRPRPPRCRNRTSDRRRTCARAAACADCRRCSPCAASWMPRLRALQ